MKNNYLVSCVMVTSDIRRWEMFKKSVKMFLNQTYNNKELIIVSNGESKYNKDIANYIKNYNNIRHIGIDQNLNNEKMILGELRNVSLNNASGEYILQWDDDDLYHETRISAQLEAILKNKCEISFIRDFLLKLNNKKSVEITYPIVKGTPQGLPGTVMFKKTDIRYKNLGKMEDSNFLLDMIDDGYTYTLIKNKSYLYTYCYQGTNTFGYNHFVIMKKWQNKRIDFNLSYK